MFCLLLFLLLSVTLFSLRDPESLRPRRRYRAFCTAGLSGIAVPSFFVLSVSTVILLRSLFCVFLSFLAKECKNGRQGTEPGRDRQCRIGRVSGVGSGGSCAGSGRRTAAGAVGAGRRTPVGTGRPGRGLVSGAGTARCSRRLAVCAAP